MTDDEFLARLADCTLPKEHFNHLGHLRLACLQLQRHAFDEAVRRSCEGIGRYATHLGAADKFHWTLTQALMHLLQAAGAAAPGQDWTEVIAANAALVANARARVGLHYSDELLASAAARTRFVAPDRAPLPPLKSA